MSENQAPEQDVASSDQISEAQFNLLVEQIRSGQNLVAGALAGLAAALVSAAIWALITALTEYQIGFMAIGVGLLVGFAVRAVGKGIVPVFGIVGALLSLLGCVCGNLLSMAWFIAANEGVTYWQLLGSLNLEFAIEIMTVTFDPMDLLFYGIALYFGFKYSFTPLASPANVDTANHVP